MSTSELQTLEVINVVDGRRLGNVYDIDLDLSAGRIRSLILPGAPASGLFRWLQRPQEIEIPWERIVKIGVDVILVRMPHLAMFDGNEPDR